MIFCHSGGMGYRPKLYKVGDSMAKKQSFNLYYIDPITGKRKLAKSQKTMKIAREQQKKKQKEIKQKQKETRLQGKIKMQQAKIVRNPKQYIGKQVSKKTGKILTKKQIVKEYRNIRKSEIKKEETKKIKKLTIEERKANAINWLKTTNGRGKQALDDLNMVGEYYVQNVYNPAPPDVKQWLNNSVGVVNTGNQWDDFYNEKYVEIMRPNMIKQIAVLQHQLERGLNAMYEYMTNISLDEYDLIQNIINELEICIEMCKQSRTEYNRLIIVAGDREPEFNKNLHESGL